MAPLAVSLVVVGLMLSGAPAHPQEQVTWYTHRAESEPVPLHQFVDASDPTPTLETIARWAGWDTGEPLHCDSSSDSLRVVALRLPRGWTLVLWNSSPQKIRVAIEGEMAAGVYTTERLTIASGGHVLAIERRNGVRLPRPSKVQRIEWLPPNCGLILHFVERVQQVDETLLALRRSVWQSRISAGTLSRLAALMRETNSHWYQVRANLRKGNVPMAARGVHRMLFLASGLQAAASRHATLQAVSEHAEQLIDALSELSAALLNVVVRLQVAEQTLKAEVANAGSQVWRAVRFTTGSAAEQEAIVLANMKPMERAEATFKWSNAETLPSMAVSVLFNNGYARLRVSCGDSREDGR
jgi:hypothetical protein